MNSHAIRRASKSLCDALGWQYKAGKRIDEIEMNFSSITVPILNKQTDQTVGKILASMTRSSFVSVAGLYASVSLHGEDLWIESGQTYSDDVFGEMRKLLLQVIERATEKAQKQTGRTPGQARRVTYERYGD